MADEMTNQCERVRVSFMLAYLAPRSSLLSVDLGRIKARFKSPNAIPLFSSLADVVEVDGLVFKKGGDWAREVSVEEYDRDYVGRKSGFDSQTIAIREAWYEHAGSPS